MSNQMMTPESSYETREHLYSYHNIDDNFLGDLYIGGLEEYRGAPVQEIHNKIHLQNIKNRISILHEHNPELLDAYAQVAHYRQLEIEELASNSK